MIGCASTSGPSFLVIITAQSSFPLWFCGSYSKAPYLISNLRPHFAPLPTHVCLPYLNLSGRLWKGFPHATSKALSSESISLLLLKSLSLCSTVFRFLLNGFAALAVHTLWFRHGPVSLASLVTLSSECGCSPVPPHSGLPWRRYSSPSCSMWVGSISALLTSSFWDPGWWRKLHCAHSCAKREKEIVGEHIEF